MVFLSFDYEDQQNCKMNSFSFAEIVSFKILPFDLLGTFIWAPTAVYRFHFYPGYGPENINNIIINNHN